MQKYPKIEILKSFFSRKLKAKCNKCNMFTKIYAIVDYKPCQRRYYCENCFNLIKGAIQ